MVWPGGRVRGYITHVAASDAFALVWNGEEPVHVPIMLLPTVRRPHFNEPLDGKSVAPPPPRTTHHLPPKGQLAFDLGDPVVGA